MKECGFGTACLTSRAALETAGLQIPVDDSPVKVASGECCVSGALFWLICLSQWAHSHKSSLCQRSLKDGSTAEQDLFTEDFRPHH